MKTEKEKMLAGELYTPYDPELQQMHQQALALVEQYNKEAFVNCLEENFILRKLLPNTHRHYGYNLLLFVISDS